MERYYLNEISKKLKISESSLRYYDEKGLFPKISRDENNYRYVLAEDLPTIDIVICLKKTAMPLKEIKRYIFLMLEGDSTVKERYEMILKQEISVNEKYEDIKAQMDFIDYKKNYYKNLLESKEDLG